MKYAGKVIQPKPHLTIWVQDGATINKRYTEPFVDRSGNSGGYIVTGTRHYCPLMRLQIDSSGGHTALNSFAGGLENVVQGFTDQYGVFLTRQEAYVIAKDAAQIIREDHCPGTLFSECYI